MDERAVLYSLTVAESGCDSRKVSAGTNGGFMRIQPDADTRKAPKEARDLSSGR